MVKMKILPVKKTILALCFGSGFLLAAEAQAAIHNFRVTAPNTSQVLQVNEPFNLRWNTDGLAAALEGHDNITGYIILKNQDPSLGIGKFLAEDLSRADWLRGERMVTIGGISNDGRDMPGGRYRIEMWVQDEVVSGAQWSGVAFAEAKEFEMLPAPRLGDTFKIERPLAGATLAVGGTYEAVWENKPFMAGFSNVEAVMNLVNDRDDQELLRLNEAEFKRGKAEFTLGPNSLAGRPLPSGDYKLLFSVQGEGAPTSVSTRGFSAGVYQLLSAETVTVKVANQISEDSQKMYDKLDVLLDKLTKRLDDARLPFSEKRKKAESLQNRLLLWAGANSKRQQITEYLNQGLQKWIDENKNIDALFDELEMFEENRDS